MGKLIDAESITKVAEHAYHEWNLGMAAAENNRQINRCYKMQELCKAVKAVAEAAPAVDAVPVIRCKDCKYWEASKCDPESHYCQMIDPWDSPEGVAFPEDFFCAYGKPVEKPVETVDK